MKEEFFAIDTTKLWIHGNIYVPTRWIFGDKAPEDGSAVCEQFFDRAYVENLNKELKLREKQEIDEILESD